MNRGLLIFVLHLGSAAAAPLDTVFTYQGVLKADGAAASGQYDFRFRVFDLDVGGVALTAPLLLSEVNVVEGVFTVELDFGTTPFAGDQLWLDIGVREGASGGAYTVLSPRQKITAVPYALHAEMVAVNAVGGNEVDSSEVQLRVSGGCAVGSAIRSISASGTVACESDDVGLTTVTGADIDSSQVQRRVLGSCPAGQAVAAINQDGTVACIALPYVRSFTSTADDPANAVGAYTSIAIGLDRLPVIAHKDLTAQALRVTKCNDPACAGGNETSTTVDDPQFNAVGDYISLAIAPDGHPVISYWDETARSLKVAKCNDPACAGGDETVTTVDDPPVNLVGDYTSIAIGADGLPVISYWDGTAKAIKVAKCNDPACAGGDETISTVDDPGANILQYSSIAVPADGLPVIAYQDFTARSLKVAKCNDPACAGMDETISVVDQSANNIGSHATVAIGADGLPIIAYYDATADAIKVAKCNDPACAGMDETVTTVDDPANNVGTDLDLAIAPDGLPVISSRDTTAQALRVTKCNDPACAGGDETVTTVDDPANNVGLYTSIAIGADGLPVISYYDGTAGALKVAKCGNPACE